MSQLTQHLKKRLVLMLPNLLIVIGATAVTTVAYPMISYQWTTQRWAQAPSSAISTQGALAQDTQTLSQQMVAQDPFLAMQAVSEGIPKPKIIDDIDYTKASNWFPDQKDLPTSDTKLATATTYMISIPKLHIEDMNVVIGGEDLDKYLIHYSGTALPGELGNPVIFGHSVLPLFYNPKSYMSIFSTLPTLEKDDEILIHYDGIEYKYVVDSYHEVKPDQIEVLEQRYDRKILTLITCVPPGTYLRRGVILANLVD